MHAHTRPWEPANGICKCWQIYTVQKGAVGNIFLFTGFHWNGFHFTPVNPKIITTAFLRLLPIHDICLSVSYLSTCMQCGCNNVCPEETVSSLLPEDYSLLLPETATPAPGLLTKQQALRKTLTSTIRRVVFSAFMESRKLGMYNKTRGQLRISFKHHQNNRWRGEFPSSCLGFYLRRAVYLLL